MANEPTPARALNPDWRSATPTDHGGKRWRFPFLLLGADPQPRPLLWVRLAAAASPRARLYVPALLDTGAHTSLGPRSLCEDMGLDFASGRLCSASTGIAGQSHAVRSHDTILSVLEPTDMHPDGECAAFGPMMLPVRFVDASMPYLLLGQADFLCRFSLAMIPRLGYFELEWLPS
jgi:hypothetical protein